MDHGIAAGHGRPYRRPVADVAVQEAVSMWEAGRHIPEIIGVTAVGEGVDIDDRHLRVALE